MERLNCDSESFLNNHSMLTLILCLIEETDDLFLKLFTVSYTNLILNSFAKNVIYAFLECPFLYRANCLHLGDIRAFEMFQ